MKTVVGEDWKAREQDLDAIAAARNSDPFAVLGPHRTSAGWVIRVFAPEAISVRALSRDGALMAELPRRKGDFFEALIPSAKERPAYRVEVDDRAWNIFVHRPLRVRAGVGPARRLSGARGYASATLPPAWRPTHPSRGRRRRVVCGVGAQRDARFRRRRVQSMGWPALLRCAGASTAACGRSSSLN